MHKIPTKNRLGYRQFGMANIPSGITYEKIVSGDIVTYNINDLDVNDPKRIKIEHTLKNLKKPEKRGFYGGL